VKIYFDSTNQNFVITIPKEGFQDAVILARKIKAKLKDSKSGQYLGRDRLDFGHPRKAKKCRSCGQYLMQATPIYQISGEKIPIQKVIAAVCSGCNYINYLTRTEIRTQTTRLD
jgi:hypothetical protein